jgi:hypothetical protein
VIYVAVAAFAAVVLTGFAWAGILRSVIRQQARERGLLIAQMLHLAGRTWTLPPAAVTVEDELDDFGLIDPAQLPDY